MTKKWIDQAPELDPEGEVAVQREADSGLFMMDSATWKSEVEV